MEPTDRTKFIGGSDSASALGLSRWRSPLDVWGEKVGAIPPEDISEKLAVKLGVRLEETVAELYTEKTGKKVRRCNDLLIHPTYPFIAAHIDRRIVGEDAILECKTTSAWKAKEWDGEDVPREYVIQGLHYLAVTGAARCDVAVLIGNQDFKIKTIERDEKTIADLIRREVHFWREFVEKNIPPSPTYRDADTLAKLYPQADPEKTIDLDSTAIATLEVLEGMESDHEALERQIDEQKNLIRAALGDAEVGRANGWLVRWSNQISKRLDTDALKKEQPDLYEKYRREAKTRRLTIKQEEKTNG